MANRIVRSIRAIRDINKQPLFTNEQNDLLSDTNDDVYVRLARRYERITGLPELENKFRNHVKDYNQFKDDTQNMLIFLNNENERQDKMIDKLNTDVDDLNKKAKRLKDITDEHTEQLKSITDDLNEFKTDVKNNREQVQAKLDELSSTLDTIQENDKQDKLQSQIDDINKTLDAIKTDLEETKAIEDMKQLNQSLKNFFSVSSNVSENLVGSKDFLYFDIYSIIDNSDLDIKNIKVTQQEMDKIGGLSEEEVYPIDETDITKKNNHYLSLRVNTLNYQHIYVFTLYINDVPYHIRQVRYTDYE